VSHHHLLLELIAASEEVPYPRPGQLPAAHRAGVGTAPAPAGIVAQTRHGLARPLPCPLI
jgi:hypothetical protein